MRGLSAEYREGAIGEHPDRPSQAELLALLRYEPETGRLFWRPRTAEMFAGSKFPDRQANSWNAKYAGREALTANHGSGHRVGMLAGYGVVRAHHVIWRMVYGTWPDRIGWRNRNPSDNRIANLFEMRRIPIGGIGYRYEPAWPAQA